MKLKRLILPVLFAVCCLNMYAQSHLTGTVVDVQGEPVIGAAVRIAGTTTGTVTDIDGQFALEATDGAKIEVSYLGYLTVELTAKELRSQGGKVVLREDTQALEEVVVVGYGVQKKSVVTAAISKVSAEDLENVIPPRVDNMLKGKASGVTITSSPGQPGAGARVNIRGVGTINDASPLYVVDGMPMDNIDYLNPTDIASIEVLKDAASAAIYGTKGANGVILVTTKSGELNQRAHVSYDMSVGFQNPWKQKAVLNGPWYQTILNEARLNDGSAPYFQQITTDPGTNWQDQLFNYNAPVQSHQVSVNTRQKTCITMSEVINPVANLELPAGWNRADRFTANLTGELQLYTDLVWKTSFNADFSFKRLTYGNPTMKAKFEEASKQ